MSRIKITLWLAAVVAATLIVAVALYSFPRHTAEPVARAAVCTGEAEVRVSERGSTWDRNFGRVRCVDAFGRVTEDVTPLTVSIVGTAALALVVGSMLAVSSFDRQQRHLRHRARARARARMG